MLWKHPFLLLSLALTTATAWAQTGTVSGRVIDAQTLEGLPFANVFINNATIGTATDANGNFILKNVPVGPAEVIYSFVGYQTYQARTVIADGQDTKVNIRLVPLQEQLNEVQVKSSRDKAWERQLKRFEKIFFGNTELARECTISNPWVIDFADVQNKFTAKASAPIEIQNRATGYKITYYLKDFWSDGTQYAIIGNSRFESLAASNAEEALRWTKNRKDAYLGSTRHLFKSLVENKSAEQGFRLYTDRASDKNSRLPSFNQDLEKSVTVIPYKLEGVVMPGNTIHEKRITIKGRVEVHYLEKPGAVPVYRDIGHSVSWLEAKNETVTVSNEGLIYNSRDLIVSGDMGSARISNLLPLDYQPQNVVTLRSPLQIRAERLYESVYLQTNKPFYYPGEMIWFKGYMNYSIRGMADTLSKIMYVDIVDAERKTVRSKIVKIDSGRVSGNIKLPPDLKSGTYGLVAYTSWMRNYGEGSFFKRALPVLNIYDRAVPAALAADFKNSKEIEFTLDKELYHLREKVIATITLQDESNKPVKAILSVSITDLTQVPYVSWASNDIRNDLKIPANIRVTDKISYPIEYGVTWNGEFQSGLKRAEKTDLTIIRGAFEEAKKVTTDINGRFSLLNLDIADSAVYNFQAIRAGETYGKVVPLSSNPPIISFNATDYSIPLERKESVQRIISNYEVPADATLLANVEIKATRLENQENLEQNQYGKADATISSHDISRFGSIEGLLRAKAPGFRLVHDGVHWFFVNNRATMMRREDPNKAQQAGKGKGDVADAVSTSGGMPPEPMLTIDNQQIFTNADNTVGDALMRLAPETIDRIEVSGVSASYVGSNNGYGLVAIFMKKGVAVDRNNFQHLTIKGYDTPMDFKGPNYDDKNEDHSQGDFRSTLFWGRDIRVGATGTTEFSFYTSDLPGKYRIVVEGVTEKGIPVRYEGVMRVE